MKNFLIKGQTSFEATMEMLYQLSYNGKYIKLSINFSSLPHPVLARNRCNYSKKNKY